MKAVQTEPAPCFRRSDVRYSSIPSFRRRPESSYGDEMDRRPCVYILANKRNGTLYTGVTSDPVRRVYLHRNGEVAGFTKKYGVHMLVYFEMHETMEAAITREKQIKEWKRAWKLRVIEESNPDWRDLYRMICR